MQKQFKILFIGDIVGRSGRKAVKKYLLTDNNKDNYDFIIANAENASHGFGLTKKNHDELLECGINCLTSGNHIWDKKDVFQYISDSPALVRPYNYHKSALGVGYRIFDDKIIVINMLGKTFLPPIACPFEALENLFNNLKESGLFNDKIIFIDFHAEATAEKQCFARYAASLGANAVIGTHTHVQTADETIFDGTCAYLTDAGFCGSKNSVIGMEYLGSLKRLITSINERFEVEMSYPYMFNACEIVFNGNKPISIKRISFEYSDDEENVGED